MHHNLFQQPSGQEKPWPWARDGAAWAREATEGWKRWDRVGQGDQLPWPRVTSVQPWTARGSEPELRSCRPQAWAPATKAVAAPHILLCEEDEKDNTRGLGKPSDLGLPFFFFLRKCFFFFLKRSGIFLKQF